MHIYPTKQFIKSFKKLPPSIKEKAIKREKIFQIDMFDVRLKTHPLKGKLSRFHSYRINRAYRIVFEIIDKETILYHDIGTHSIYL